MLSTVLSIVIYVIAAAASVYLGLTLRKWRDRSTQNKLTRDVEAVLNEPLPKFKKIKSSEQVNWDRVYKSLQKLPESEEITKLKTRVDKQQRLYYKNRIHK